MSGELKIASADAMTMANTVFGNGISIVSASYSGQSGQVGVYSGALTTMAGVAPSDRGLILSTGKVSDMTQSSGDANISEGTSTAFNTAGDAMLSKVSGQQTFDAAVFTSTFIPQGDTLTMQIVWSSEEYLEYVNQGFNDAFAVWVNGVPATLNIGDGDITINNINNVSNANLYKDNAAATNTYDTEMDGFTVTLTLKAPVKPGVQNTFRMAIADAGDAYYDSTVMVAADSVQVALIADDDTLTINPSSTKTINVLGNDSSSVAGALTITKINGVAVTVGSAVKLPSGDVITVGQNGVLTVQTAQHQQDSVLTYEVKDTAGNTDVAFLTLKIVPCFVAGTQVDVPGGSRAVDDLRPGDLVLTRDHGPQPVRWIGRVARPAFGVDAPVEIRAGTLGPHGDLRLSPNHRILLQGARAELLCGEAEVLVKAKHLVDGRAIRQIEGGTVTYVHILFDRHEIVMANGLASESYLPGPETMTGFDADTQAEVRRLFPAIRPDGTGYGPLARPEVKAREAWLLRA